jgi:hypothetical protein
MNFFYKILLAILLPILGFTLACIAWAVPIISPLNTILFTGGLMLVPVGAIAPFFIPKKKK